MKIQNHFVKIFFVLCVLISQNSGAVESAPVATQPSTVQTSPTVVTGSNVVTNGGSTPVTTTPSSEDIVQPIGVAECDAVIVKINECYKKLPKDESNPKGFRQTIKTSMREIVQTWVSIMATTSPAIVCARAHENWKVKPFMSEFGCSF